MRYFVIAWLVLCSGSPFAQDCVDYVDNQIQILDTMSLDGLYTYDLAIEGDVAFVSSAYFLHSVDISDPNNLQLISSLPDYGGTSIAVNNGLACRGGFPGLCAAFVGEHRLQKWLGTSGRGLRMAGQ